MLIYINIKIFQNNQNLMLDIYALLIDNFSFI